MLVPHFIYFILAISIPKKSGYFKHTTGVRVLPSNSALPIPVSTHRAVVFANFASTCSALLLYASSNYTIMAVLNAPFVLNSVA
jgi:hypothetical protein